MAQGLLPASFQVEAFLLAQEAFQIKRIMQQAEQDMMQRQKQEKGTLSEIEEDTKGMEKRGACKYCILYFCTSSTST